MSPENIQQLAAIVDDAVMNRTEIDQIAATNPALTMEVAYQIQAASVARRIERGERLVGMKMGLTSRAKMEQMGVHEPIYGRLTSSMILNNGATIQHGDLIHPRIEPEVAFLLKRDLSGPVTPAEALLAVEGVCAALEIIDSRYRDFKFTLPDVVADNTSAVLFALGDLVKPPDAVNLGNLGIVMEINGVAVEIGSSAAILEHPARSLAELANMLARRGESLKAGQIVLAGGATAAVAINPGDHIRAVVDELGVAEVRVR